ncbi:hypothetical protein XCR1_4400005 [Xenorhabdus cabanillasii JM26]|uniref:Uncharacterized protein n=1 Tax=Xenorhabdus cabanillasii JM26 TaxID=1427517 RepID=W1J7H9_9GAMM|nr:hypothetical protein Xcab_04203 [Xenorhabdus cabanillasii JM26]CDL86717.1 hypothetical protein XCR1_4400005 [Xenorhabdus cabanillasii JM26]
MITRSQAQRNKLIDLLNAIERNINITTACFVAAGYQGK